MSDTRIAFAKGRVVPCLDLLEVPFVFRIVAVPVKGLLGLCNLLSVESPLSFHGDGTE